MTARGTREWGDPEALQAECEDNYELRKVRHTDKQGALQPREAPVVYTFWDYSEENIQWQGTDHHALTAIQICVQDKNMFQNLVMKYFTLVAVAYPVNHTPAFRPGLQP